ncbi:UvrD-helicase domain-containing protein [Rivibacter subsaxonicus]|uniref:DNA 3'-5' helicase n=1 Tax=Rivibacter subsaxonicus TaxID=457575 RepID=A0A4Q7VPJ5_9BURK|nr:UvrD-helicase domain-containing protein [Rivibacter subsaxonicus]RZT98058.1 ATP-dependent helicase/nuclease subunit A [Rivibacter subsaxonicus]
MSAAAYRIDGEVVAPEVFYALACDPRRSVVVEACAGAGKTWMLVSRILRALLDGVAPQEILAITFTRKAAGEMRERLDDWLREFALCDDGKRMAELRLRGCSEAEARALAPRLAALEGELLALPRAVEIRTFHGWFSQLLRAAPSAVLDALGLSAEPRLVEQMDEWLPALWREFLTAAAADPALRADFETLVRQRGRFTANKWLEAVLGQRIEFERADAAGQVDASVPPPHELWPEFLGLSEPRLRLADPGLRATLTVLARRLGAQKGAKSQQAAREIEMALTAFDASGDAVPGFDALWLAIHTKKDELRAPLQAEDLRDAVEPVVEALWRIKDAIDQQAAHEEQLRLARLSRCLLQAWRDFKRERALLDMADLELGAEALLSDPVLSGWVLERLDTRVRHLLIDEFQDTSPLQWRTLEAWLAGYAGAGGGASGQRPPSVFIVGDPKQSIYRFRRADPRLFTAAAEFVVQALDGVVLSCDHTRRNSPVVLAALNEVFGQAQAEGEYGGFRPHTSARPELAGAVRLIEAVPRPPRGARGGEELPVWRDTLLEPREAAEEALRMIEARAVAAGVDALLQRERLSPKDVMVLARKRVPLGHVAQALRERGLPCVMPEERALLDAPEVRDLLALLDALVSPMHALSLAQALKSPIFGVGDAALIALAQSGARRAADWWPAVVDQPPPPGLDPLEEAALRRTAGLLAGWQAAARVLPPHDLLDRIVAEGDLRARYAAAVPPLQRADALAAIDALLAQSLALDGGRRLTPYRFVRELRRRPLMLPRRADADAVQLLTVHGAKGLEAAAVFLIDTQPEASQGDSASLLVDWPPGAAAPRSVAFLASAARCPPSLRADLESELQARLREELNGLYVAMTRAKQWLQLSATAAHRAAPGRNAWARLDAAGVEVQARPQDVAAPARAEAAMPILLRELPVADATAWPGVDEARVDEPQAALARLGTALHRVLEWGPAPGAGLERAVAAAAQAFGVTAEAEIESLRMAAQRVLHGSATRRFFDAAQLRAAHNELPLHWQGQALRIDRLVAFDTPQGRQWWVLDHKLHPAPHTVPALCEQLARYRDAVRALQPDDEVRAAFLTAEGGCIELDAP